jgi:hypothetical protein
LGFVQCRLEGPSLLLYGREEERTLQDSGHEIDEAGRVRVLAQPDQVLLPWKLRRRPIMLPGGCASGAGGPARLLRPSLPPMLRRSVHRQGRVRGEARHFAFLWNPPMTILTLHMDPRLVRMPEDHWRANLSSHEVGAFVRVDQSIGPEGFLTRMSCAGCSKKRAILVRPAGRIHAMVPAIRAATGNRVVREQLKQWVDRHGSCRNTGREVVIPEPFAGYVSLLKKRAVTRLEGRQPPESLLMLTSEASRPVLIDCREVFSLPEDRRYRRGCQLVAALRDRMRGSEETFTSAITYREGLVDSRGRSTVARIDIETPHGRYSGEASIRYPGDDARIEAVSMAEVAFGVGTRNTAMDDVFVIETRL